MAKRVSARGPSVSHSLITRAAASLLLAVGLAGITAAANSPGNQILWRNASGDAVIWFVNGGTISSVPDLGIVPSSWTIQGTGDFNGDGQSDILWRNTGDGAVVIWFMNGGTVASSTNLGAIPASWKIQGIGDFNADGTPDILWRNSNGDVTIWFMLAGAIASSADLGVTATSWVIQGTADFNGDGTPDILWRNNDGDAVVWFMGGGGIVSSTDFGVIPSSWMIQGTADFNGDGSADILWRNANGDAVIWFLSAGVISFSTDFGVIPNGFTIQGTADLNGAGTADILWRNSNGDVVAWFMNGGAIGSSTDYGVIPAAWNVSTVGATAKAAFDPGTLAVSVAGSQLIDAWGNAIQLRGVNLSGMEGVGVQGWDLADPTGGEMGQPFGPNWLAIQSWKANVVRIPLNEDSWLGLTCTDINGDVRNADPGANYQQTLTNLIRGANDAGLYVILDLHWAAPGNLCPLFQGQMADADNSVAFWTSIANTYRNNPAVLFELFNEPYFTNDFQGNAWSYLMFGTEGGPFTGIPAEGVGDPLWYEDYQTTWNIASYQQLISAVRSTGAPNVLLIGSVAYTSELSGWLANMPSDPLNQMAASWHPYPTYGTTWGTPAYAQPQNSPQIFTEVQNILAAGIPVIITETGDQNSPGTGIGAGCALPANYSLCAPLVTTVVQFADQNGLSVLGWTWDLWYGASSFVLIQDDNGTPTDGYGQVFQSWLVNHP